MKLVIIPTVKSSEQVKKRIHTAIHMHNNSNPDALIEELNGIVRSWCSYHNHIQSKGTFETLDRFLTSELTKWKEYKDYNDSNCPNTPSCVFPLGNCQAIKFSETPYKPHSHSDNIVNPYLNENSFKDISDHHETNFMVI